MPNANKDKYLVITPRNVRNYKDPEVSNTTFLLELVRLMKSNSSHRMKIQNFGAPILLTLLMSMAAIAQQENIRFGHLGTSDGLSFFETAIRK